MSSIFPPFAILQGVMSGQSQASGYKYNAAIERQQAGQALDAADVRAREIADRVMRTAGEAKAQYGASGVVPTSGSPLAVLNDIATEGEMSRQLALYQGRVQATGHEEQSDADLAQATSALTGGWVNGVGSFLGNAAQMASDSGVLSKVGPWLAAAGV